METPQKEQATARGATRTLTELAAQLAVDLEHLLHSRRAKEGTLAARAEGLLKNAGTFTWIRLKKHPVLGTLAIGAAVALGASAVGAAEIAIGLVAGLSAYKVLRGEETAERALEEIASDVH